MKKFKLFLSTIKEMFFTVFSPKKFWKIQLKEIEETLRLAERTRDATYAHLPKIQYCYDDASECMREQAHDLDIMVESLRKEWSQILLRTV